MGDTHDAERRQPLSEGCTVVEVAAVCIRAHRNVFVPGMFNPFVPTVPTCAVRETASLGIMGAPRVPPLSPSESILLSEHYRL